MSAAHAVALCALLAASQARSVVIDRIVATVDKEVITESELFVEARVALVAREGRRGLVVADAPLDEDLLAMTRDYLVNQLLIGNHLRRLGSVEVSSIEVERELARFVRVFPSNDAYEAFKRKYSISEPLIRDILRRDLWHERYIDQRMRGWGAGDANDPDSAERAKKAFERWLADLRRGAEVRLLGPTGELERQ